MSYVILSCLEHCSHLGKTETYAVTLFDFVCQKRFLSEIEIARLNRLLSVHTLHLLVYEDMLRHVKQISRDPHEFDGEFQITKALALKASSTFARFFTDMQ